MAILQKILELYHDYVNSCLMFDNPPEEIMGFDEFAELHHGVPKEEAQEWFYREAETA